MKYVTGSMLALGVILAACSEKPPEFREVQEEENIVEIQANEAVFIDKEFDVTVKAELYYRNLLVLDSSFDGTVAIHTFPGDADGSDYDAYNAVEKGLKTLEKMGITDLELKDFRAILFE